MTTTPDDPDPAAIFVKQCPKCRTSFRIEDLECSESIQPVGMSYEGAPEDSAYYFNHLCPDCGTTFVVPIRLFADRIDEPLPEALLAGSAACAGHCTRLPSLQVCEEPCRNAPFRRFLVNVLARRGGRR